MASSSSDTSTQNTPTNGKRVGKLIAKFGVAGFLFFLIKGMLWLTVPALLLSMGIQCSP